MKSNQKLKQLTLAPLLLLIFLIVGGSSFLPVDIEIDVAPNVLNIQSEGTVVTVHTSIEYSAVDGASVKLNGVPISWWKSDSRGLFVAKFNMEEVESLVSSEIIALGNIVLTLEGSSNQGEFIGSQTIKVICVEAKGR